MAGEGDPWGGTMSKPSEWANREAEKTWRDFWRESEAQWDNGIVMLCGLFVLVVGAYMIGAGVLVFVEWQGKTLYEPMPSPLVGIPVGIAAVSVAMVVSYFLPVFLLTIWNRRKGER